MVLCIITMFTSNYLVWGWNSRRGGANPQKPAFWGGVLPKLEKIKLPPPNEYRFRSDKWRALSSQSATATLTSDHALTSDLLWPLTSDLCNCNLWWLKTLTSDPIRSISTPPKRDGTIWCRLQEHQISSDLLPCTSLEWQLSLHLHITELLKYQLALDWTEDA